MLGLTDCIERYARKRGITKIRAEEEFKTALEVLADACLDGGVSIRGMFTIKPKYMRGRVSELKGVTYNIDEKYTLKIKTGSDLEARLNEKYLK